MVARRLYLLAACLAAALAASPAAAHSVQELEGDLFGRERYFQPLEGRGAPGFTLRDGDGREVSLEDFRGMAVVLHFVYASCPDACPLHADLIARVQAMVNRTPMRDLVRFVTITTDPVNDTPEVLRAYGPAHGLDPANWLFLTSGPEWPGATRALVERFGHKFTATAGGAQVHSVVTHVIDREGRWRANFHGLEFEPINLVSYVNALTNDDGHGVGEGGTVVRNPVQAEGGAAGDSPWLPLALGGLVLAAAALVTYLLSGRRPQDRSPEAPGPGRSEERRGG